MANSDYGIQFLIPTLAVLVNIAAHILISRYWLRQGTIISTLLAFLLGTITIAGLELKFHSTLPLIELVSMSLVNFIIFGGVAFTYWSLINIGECSVRIRVLIELDSETQGLMASELMEKYSAQEIIETRLNRMLATGEIVKQGDRYFFSGSAKMLLVAKICQKLKILMLGKPSFDPKLVESP